MQLLRLHFADHVSVQVIHRLTMPSVSDIQHVTSLTEKEVSYRMDRFLQLHLWMPALSQQRQLIRDTLQQLQMLMLSSQDQHTILTAQSMLTEYLTAKGVADPEQEIQFGPNIKDWPEMVALPENLIIKVVSEIHDPVTTTDELIPSGETSSFRSNPLGLAEFALSRKGSCICRTC